MSLLHSLWQAALLMLVYVSLEAGIKKQAPAFKRNFLYVLLLAQCILVITTFFIYYTGDTAFYADLSAGYFTRLLPSFALMQQLAPWLSGIYSTVIIGKGVYLLYRWRQFRLSCNNNLIKPPVDIKVFTLVKGHEFGIKRKVSIWLSDIVSTPVTFGYLKPIVLLPVALINQLTITEVESLIIHELTHIKNNDYLLNLLLLFSETLFFFNPFMLFINYRIRLEREKNCDVQVLTFNYSAVGYAETLFKAARFRNRPNVFHLPAVFKNRQLLQRIVFFTTTSNLSFRKRNHGMLAFSSILGIMLLNLVIMVQLNNKPVNKRDSSQVSADNSQFKMIYAANMLEKYTQQSIQPAFKHIESGASKAVAKDLPILQENLNKIQPMINLIQNEAARLSEQLVQNNFALPASLIEKNNTKEFEVTEEASNGHIVRKLYKLRQKNGVWEVEPLWMITETRSLTDSLNILRDSGLRVIPPIQ